MHRGQRAWSPRRRCPFCPEPSWGVRSGVRKGELSWKGPSLPREIGGTPSPTAQPPGGFPRGCVPGLNSTSSQFAGTGDRPPPAAHRTGRSPSGTSLSVTFCPTPQSDFQQDACPEDVSFGLDTEELRKVLLRRPDCPQFSTRATSMSHFGESHPPRPTGKPPPALPGSVLVAASESPCGHCVWDQGTEEGVPGGDPRPLSLCVWVHLPASCFSASFGEESVGLGVEERETIPEASGTRFLRPQGAHEEAAPQRGLSQRRSPRV